MSGLELVEDTEETTEGVVEPHMTDSELVSVCTNEVSRGTGGSISSDNDANITLPIEYYFGRAPGLTGTRAKDPNASRYVSMDVMDAVEATVAEIMPTFTSEMIALYSPEDERDEDQSKTESELVNNLFFEEYDGYTLLQVALKDALLNRNCTAKAYWDERAYVEYEVIENIPEMALAMVMTPQQPDQKIDILEQIVTEEGNPGAIIALQAEADGLTEMESAVAAQSPQVQQVAQQAMMAAQDKFTIKVRRTTVKGKPVIESVAPENAVVAGSHKSPYLHDARFCAHDMSVTESDLIEQGFEVDQVKNLPTYSTNIEEEARSRDSDEYDYTSQHHSTRLIRVYECYPLIDFDGDGIAERRKVSIAGNELLRYEDGSTANEEIDDVPLIGGVTMVNPHKYQGISMFDRLKQIQDGKTPICRAIIDGTLLSAHPRVGILDGDVNLDDMLVTRTGGNVRMKRMDAVMPFPNPEVPPSSYAMLDWFDKVRRDRGGGAIDTANTAQAMHGDAGFVVDRVMGAMELNNAVMARSFGETLIRGIFIEIHNLLRKHHKGTISSKVGGRWINSTPSEWRTRTNVVVQIGSSHTERSRQAGVVREVIKEQKELLSVGSVLADEKRLYTAETDMVSLAGVKNPDRYFVDPESQEGQAAQQQSDAESAQEKQKNEQIQGAMLKSQLDLGRAELMKGEADIQAQHVKLEVEKQKQQDASVIAMLEMKLEQMKQDAQDYKDGAAQRFDYEKLASDNAIRITELEMQANRDMSAQVEENANELGED